MVPVKHICGYVIPQNLDASNLRVILLACKHMESTLSDEANSRQETCMISNALVERLQSGLQQAQTMNVMTAYHALPVAGCMVSVSLIDSG